MCGRINARWSAQFKRLFRYHGDDIRINLLQYTLTLTFVNRNTRKADIISETYKYICFSIKI